MAAIWRRHFRIHFLNDDWCVLVSISLKFVPKGPIDHKASSVQIMAWRWTCIIWTNDGLIYWRTYASLSLRRRCACTVKPVFNDQLMGHLDEFHKVEIVSKSKLVPSVFIKTHYWINQRQYILFKRWSLQIRFHCICGVSKHRTKTCHNIWCKDNYIYVTPDLTEYVYKTWVLHRLWANGCFWSDIQQQKLCKGLYNLWIIDPHTAKRTVLPMARSAWRCRGIFDNNNNFHLDISIPRWMGYVTQRPKQGPIYWYPILFLSQWNSLRRSRNIGFIYLCGSQSLEQYGGVYVHA